MNDFVDMPSVRMDLAAYQNQEYFPMSKRDWVRLRSKVDNLRKRRREWSAVGWSAVGVLATAATSALTWAPAYRAMTADLRFEFSWVWPAIVALALIALAVGTIAFMVSAQYRDDARATAQEILDDMDEIYDPNLSVPPVRTREMAYLGYLNRTF